LILRLFKENCWRDAFSDHQRIIINKTNCQNTILGIHKIFCLQKTLYFLNAYKQPSSYHRKKMDIFGNLIQQLNVPINLDTFGVWIPLAFGLAVGLAYVIASGLRRPT
jgi:hypothetical protein